MCLDGDRIKERTLTNLSKLPPAAIDTLSRVRRGEQPVDPEDVITCMCNCLLLTPVHIVADGLLIGRRR